MDRICNRCGDSYPESRFWIIRVLNGVTYRRKICNVCVNKNRVKRNALSPADKRERRRKKNLNYRRDPKNAAGVLMWGARHRDKAAGRETRLEKDWVKIALLSPCSYCGETDLVMTLDRIDNSIGYVTENLIPACERCNYFRRDLPFAAWQLLVPGMRKAQKLGLLKGWNCSVHKRNNKSEDESTRLLSQTGNLCAP